MADPTVYEDDADAPDQDNASDLLGGALQSALNPTTTREAQETARHIIGEWESGAPREGEEPILNDIETNADSAKAALRQAQQRLMEMKISPEEQRFDRAAAWLAPTRTGRFGDTLSNVARTYGEQAKEARELELAKSQSQGQLAQQMYGIDQNTLNAKLALQKLREQQWGPIVSRALQIEGRSIAPNGGNKHLQLKQLHSPDGKTQNVLFDPSTGDQTPQGAPFYQFPTPSDATIQAMSDYRIPGPTSAYAEAHPEAMDLLNKLIAKNPAYDASIQPAISKTRAWWASGPQANKIASLNMAINHLHFLDQAYDALNNTHDALLLNKIGNTLGLHLEGKSPQAAFQAIQGFVAGEVTNAVQQSSGVTEREGQLQRVNRDFSTPVGHEVADTYRKLLSARLEAERNKFYSGMQLGVFDPGSPKYNYWKKTLDQQFRTGLSPRTIATLDPAPQAALADLQAHPEHAEMFKNHYGYLPGDLQ